MALFQERGYEAATTAAIAERAGVTEMTLFRHFATKDALLLDDPYDPTIAESIRTRPSKEIALTAAARGIVAAWSLVDPAEAEALRQRLRIVAQTPSLRGAVANNMRRTEDAVAQALISRGTEAISARMVAAGVLAALNAGLLGWASDDSVNVENVFRSFHQAFGDNY